MKALKRLAFRVGMALVRYGMKGVEGFRFRDFNPSITVNYPFVTDTESKIADAVQWSAARRRWRFND